MRSSVYRGKRLLVAGNARAGGNPREKEHWKKGDCLQKRNERGGHTGSRGKGKKRAGGRDS